LLWNIVSESRSGKATAFGALSSQLRLTMVENSK
jgi:hypothetical protein